MTASLPMFQSTAPATTLDAASGPAWRDHLAPGCIVAYRFPAAEEDPGEEPKIRPCLVLEVEDVGGHRRALLAYGTSSPQRPQGGYDVAAHERRRSRETGLDRPTRFQCDRRLLVGLGNTGFGIASKTSSPVLGHLDRPALQRLHVVRARIQAEADIAADRRRERARETARQRHDDERRAQATRSTRMPRWRAVAKQAQPLVEHRRHRSAGLIPRHAALRPAEAASAASLANLDAAQNAGRPRPILTVPRLASVDVITAPETSR